MEQWRKLVTPGHVWAARFNAFTWVGVVCLGLFALSLVRDIHGNTTGLAQKMSQMKQEPGTWWERFSAAPWDTLKGMASGSLQAGEKPRPRLDMAVLGSIMAVPQQAQLTAENLTKPADLKVYIDDNVKALNATGKLSVDYPVCDKLDDLRKPWVNGKTGLPDVPRCAVSGSGDTIWMASIVSDGGTYMVTATPWLGVFHKDAKAGKWAYYNTDGIVPASRAKLQGYKSVNFDMIPYQVEHDFPYLVTKAQEPAHE